MLILYDTIYEQQANDSVILTVRYHTNLSQILNMTAGCRARARLISKHRKFEKTLHFFGCPALLLIQNIYVPRRVLLMGGGAFCSGRASRERKKQNNTANSMLVLWDIQVTICTHRSWYSHLLYLPLNKLQVYLINGPPTSALCVPFTFQCTTPSLMHNPWVTYPVKGWFWKGPVMLGCKWDTNTIFLDKPFEFRQWKKLDDWTKYMFLTTW